MSLAEFSEALKNKAIKSWFTDERNKGGSDLSAADRSKMSSKLDYAANNVNTLVNATSDYRSAEQVASKTSFLITRDTVAALLTDLKGLDNTNSDFDKIVSETFSKFRQRNSGINVNRRKITVGKDTPAVFFNSISFDGITNLVNNILDLKAGELSKQYEKGHVVGLNTELLQVTRNRIADINTAGSTGKAKFIQELDRVIAYYRRLDYDSANIQPSSEVSIYASVEKELKKTGQTKYLVELQPKSANQRSADEVKATIGSIRKLFSPNNLSEKELLKIITKLQDSVSDPTFQQDLLDLKSSPSFIDLAAKVVLDNLIGKAVDTKIKHTNVKVATKVIPKPDLSEIRKIAADEIKKLETLKKSISAKASKIKLAGTNMQVSLTSLKNLLNSKLMEQITNNMGDGTSKRILNFRTGRFAASAHVERLTQSREGMISAFYTYLKYPYQTFEPGYQQGSPATRDPKLLISKSIREIAATKVANRMRAVLI